MQRPVKYVEKGFTKAAKGLWNAIQFVDQKFDPNKAFTPKWADRPVLKTWEKSKPPLGWPRQTDSLCPKCVVEARDQIINGDVDYNVLRNQKVGEIKATIVERDDQIWMIKDCPTHGRVEDLMAIDSKFLEHIESNFPGRDIRAHNDRDLHNHGSSNSRFLLFPWVQVKFLASKALGLALQQLPQDWQQRHGYRPVLVETFVDLERYRASWCRSRRPRIASCSCGRASSARWCAWRASTTGSGSSGSGSSTPCWWCYSSSGWCSRPTARAMP